MEYRIDHHYAWCMVEGSIVYVVVLPRSRGIVHFTGPDQERCRGEHRKVAIQVTAAEYPDTDPLTSVVPRTIHARKK